jgi:hypothetical protein
MKSRQIRHRRAFQFESLEIRNAPSHFGAVAHAAIALHAVHAAAHVRHLHNTSATERNSSIDKSQDGSTTETNSSLDKSRDQSVDTTSNDPSSIDPKSDR